MKCSSSKKIVIAIDGFSSCGKSTFARRLAAELGYIFIDTGAMYRAVTLFAIEHGVVNGIDINENKLEKMLGDMDITFRFNPQRQASDIYVNGRNVEGEIRTVEVSNTVSSVSSIPAVRTKLVALQQQMGRGKGVVLDGRDIGTVVFPDAELKIFMTADPHIRAVRRYEELKAAGNNVSLEEIEKNIRERDLADQQRKISPLRKATDAIELDNSQMSVGQQMEWVCSILEKKFETL